MIIDQEGDSSVKLGNSALGQEQYLLHDIIKRSSEQLRFIYSSDLNNTVGNLDPSVRDEVSKFVSMAYGIPFDDQSSILEDDHNLQLAANKLFSVAPGDDARVILYGMLVGDLRENPKKGPADIELFGFNVRNKTLNKNPSVAINGVEIPSNLISVKDQIVLVDLPEKLKQDLHFGETPCVVRDTFSVSVTFYTVEAHGFWPFASTKEAPRNFELHALPSARNFDLFVSYDFERPRYSSKTESFSQKSPLVSAECGQTTPTMVGFDAPPEARDITCAASWVDIRAAKSLSQSCHVEGKSVKASGAITAFAMVCSDPRLCNCSEAGRGRLQIDGAYKIQQTSYDKIFDVALGKYSLPAESEVTIPVKFEPEAKLRQIGISFKRKACPETIDHLRIVFDVADALVVKGISKSGLFHAAYSGGQIVVKHSSTESTVGESDLK